MVALMEGEGAFFMEIVFPLYNDFSRFFSAIIEKLNLHRAPKLPIFKYHPDPIATGNIMKSDIKCECCGRKRGYIYTGPVFGIGNDNILICPWCIANGKAHQSLGVIFIEEEKGVGGYGIWENVSKDVIHEIAYRTPSFDSFQHNQWWTHCGDAAKYLGCVGHDELELYGAETIETIRKSIGFEEGPEWDDVFSELDKDSAPVAYLFQCIKCGKVGGYMEFD